jgi:hypothetical protein
MAITQEQARAAQDRLVQKYLLPSDCTYVHGVGTQRQLAPGRWNRLKHRLGFQADTLDDYCVVVHSSKVPVPKEAGFPAELDGVPVIYTREESSIFANIFAKYVRHQG